MSAPRGCLGAVVGGRPDGLRTYMYKFLILDLLNILVGSNGLGYGGHWRCLSILGLLVLVLAIYLFIVSYCRVYAVTFRLLNQVEYRLILTTLLMK